MYEHEGKLLVRCSDGMLHDCFITLTETGGCTLTLRKETYNSRPVGATPTCADTIVRAHNLAVGESYPMQANKSEDSVETEQDKIAAMAQQRARR